MLIPKASHLVERVAETAAAVRRPGRFGGAAFAAADTERSDMRSSAPRPRRPVAKPQPARWSAALSLLRRAGRQMAARRQAGSEPPRRRAAASASEPNRAGRLRHVGTAPPPRPPAGRSVELDAAAFGSRRPPASDTRPGPRTACRGPRDTVVQGPSSIDAVSLERAGMVDWSRTRTRISEEFRLVQRQIIRSAFGPGVGTGVFQPAARHQRAPWRGQELHVHQPGRQYRPPGRPSRAAGRCRLRSATSSATTSVWHRRVGCWTWRPIPSSTRRR